MRVLFAMWVVVLLLIPAAEAAASVRPQAAPSGTTVPSGAVAAPTTGSAPATTGGQRDARTIVLTPASGAPGQAVAVTGAGWSPAFGRVSIWLDSGSSAAPVLLANATVDRRGTASGTGIVPRLGVGAHRVAACQSCTDGLKAERACADGAPNPDDGCSTLLIVFLATHSGQVSGSPGNSVGTLPSVGATAASASASDAAALPSPSWRPALTASALAVTAGVVVLLVGLFAARRRSPLPPPVRVERLAGDEPGAAEVAETPRRIGPALRVVGRADDPATPTVTEVRR